MLNIKMTLILAVLMTFLSCGDDEQPNYEPPVSSEVNVDFYLTTPDKTNLLNKTTDGLFALTSNDNFTINISENTTYQDMDGFGYTLTGGSAILLNNMSS
jgi:glucosylceramidase